MSKLPELPPHHHEWILKAAHEQFAERVADYEQRIMRHEHFAAEPQSTTSIKVEPRAEEIERLRGFLQQYRTICEWLRITRAELSEKISSDSAVGVAEYLRERHGVPKKAAKKRK